MFSKQEVEDMFLPQQNTLGETSSLTGGVMKDLFQQDKFPGIEEVFDFLPHLGELFTGYFDLIYNRVNLNSHFSKEDIFMERLPLRIERKYGKKTFTGFISGFQFIFSESGISRDEFTIAEKHVKLGFPSISEQFTNWLENRISEVLKRHDFYLRLSGQSKTSLAMKYNSIPIFAALEKGMRLEPLKFYIEADPPCPAVKTPNHDSFFSAPWNEIIPDLHGDVNDHHRYLSMVADWYRVWISAKNLDAAGKGLIDLKKLWRQYRENMNYWNDILNTQ